jgi:hypothetical protein
LYLAKKNTFDKDVKERKLALNNFKDRKFEDFKKSLKNRKIKKFLIKLKFDNIVFTKELLV